MSQPELRLSDYLAHIREACREAIDFTEGMKFEDFTLDIKSQRAVMMDFIMIGEASTRIAKEYPEFIASRSDIPWIQMRGMRNRVAHGYFDLNLSTVWKSIQVELPELLTALAK